MRKSIGARFLIVGVLTLLMFVPLFFVSDIVQSRKHYSERTLRDVGREWGGEQVLAGPVLQIPVQETVDVTRQEPLLDPATGEALLDQDGQPRQRAVTRSVTVMRDPIYIYPNRFDARLASRTQVRHRGIFNVPVYQADVDMRFDFPTELAETLRVNEEVILWDDAQVLLSLSSNAALRGAAELQVDGAALALEPLVETDGDAGIMAQTGDPRKRQDYHLSLGLNGAQSLMVAPVGRMSQIDISSDWPHPSFTGMFLPDGSEISDDGFTATWGIPHLARTLPQTTRDDYSFALRNQMAFGVNLIETNDFYQKSYRAANYSILFIALTFLTVLLVERGADRPAHPVQYILIGLAQSIFVLLMVAYSEQIGFGPAYALSAGATIALLTFFGGVGLKLGRRTLVLGMMLVVLYAVLYLILRSADYALLAGASLAFIALAATMYFTRNEDWYGPEDANFWGRRKKAPADADAPKGAAPHEKSSG